MDPYNAYRMNRAGVVAVAACLLAACRSEPAPSPSHTEAVLPSKPGSPVYLEPCETACGGSTHHLEVRIASEIDIAEGTLEVRIDGAGSLTEGAGSSPIRLQRGDHARCRIACSLPAATFARVTITFTGRASDGSPVAAACEYLFAPEREPRVEAPVTVNASGEPIVEQTGVTRP